MIKKIFFVFLLFWFCTSYGACKVTQSEDKHLLKWHWSMYAIDYACWGKPFEVKSPMYFPYYTVFKIGKDKRLWNYIILQNWDLKFLYWHTKGNLLEWDLILSWTKIWDTVLTWITTGYHFHLELWKGNKNIKLSYLDDWIEIINNKSSLLIIQREVKNKLKFSEILETPNNDNKIKVLNFIKDFEWIHLKSYWDSKRYSIWMWTPSYEGEIITKEEAEKRALEHINWLTNKYKLDKYWVNNQIALTSFVYNIWNLPKKISLLLEQKNIPLVKKEILKYNKVKWKVSKGVNKRRIAETGLVDSNF